MSVPLGFHVVLVGLVAWVVMAGCAADQEEVPDRYQGVLEDHYILEIDGGLGKEGGRRERSYWIIGPRVRNRGFWQKNEVGKDAIRNWIRVHQRALKQEGPTGSVNVPPNGCGLWIVRREDVKFWCPVWLFRRGEMTWHPLGSSGEKAGSQSVEAMEQLEAVFRLHGREPDQRTLQPILERYKEFFRRHAPEGVYLLELISDPREPGQPMEVNMSTGIETVEAEERVYSMESEQGQKAVEDWVRANREALNRRDPFEKRNVIFPLTCVLRHIRENRVRSYLIQGVSFKPPPPLEKIVSERGHVKVVEHVPVQEFERLLEVFHHYGHEQEGPYRTRDGFPYSRSPF